MVNTYKTEGKTNMIRLLILLGGLDNARLRPSDGSDEKDFDLPPILVWNYLTEDPEVIKFIEKAVKDYPWQDPWTFETIRDKWLLYPTRVKEKNEQLGFMDDINRNSFYWFEENEPGFGQRTNKDFHKFTEYFEKIVRERMDNKLKTEK